MTQALSTLRVDYEQCQVNNANFIIIKHNLLFIYYMLTMLI